jgi:hypothetical protein
MRRRLDNIIEIPKLNKLLLLRLRVGRWKEITNDVLILKRDVDEVMFTNHLLFSTRFRRTRHSWIAFRLASSSVIVAACRVGARYGRDPHAAVDLRAGGHATRVRPAAVQDQA